MYFRQDKGVTVHAEHGLMFEDARQHQRAAYFYKLAILLGCQTSHTELDYNVDSVLVGIAEAYDGEWQDTGMVVCASLLPHTTRTPIACVYLVAKLPSRDTVVP